MAEGKTHIDDLLRDALGSYAEVPPQGAWEDMESKLEAEGPGSLDDQLRNAFAGYTEIPPVGAWADMEARLEEKPRRRRGFIWFWTAAACVGILAGGWWIWGEGTHQGNHTAKKETATTAPAGTAGQKPEAAVPATTSESEPGAAVPQSQSAPQEAAPVNEKLRQQQPPSPRRVVSTTPDIPVRSEQSSSSTRKETTANTTVPAGKNTGSTVATTTGTADTASSQKAEDAPTLTQTSGIQPGDREQDSTGQEEDDIAAAMRKRGKGVVMNVTRGSAPDTMAAADSGLTVADKPEAIPASRAPEDTTEKVAQRTATNLPADSINKTAAETLAQTQRALLSQQDGIKQPTPKGQETQFLPPADDLKRLAVQNEASDVGSLQAFIGPLQDASANAETQVAIEEMTEKIRHGLFLDVFAKVGYEQGFYKQTAHKFVLSPSFRLGFSDKFSVLLQPAFKLGRVNYSTVSDPTSYYRITESLSDSNNSIISSFNAQGIPTNAITWTYYYRQSHDSMVVSHSLRSRMVVEAELPVMASYNLGRGWSLYGGPVVTYSNVLKIDEHARHYAGATRRDTFSYTQPLILDKKKAPTTEEVFQYNVENITTLNPAPYTNTTTNKVRLGYMVGTSWMFRDKLSVDLSVQQNLSRMDYIPNAGIRNIYLQPYVRFMMGYKLSGKRK
ncbi:MAG: hypothetical protein JNL72_10430 [Flavipsychrobacter sp.]|nr:hypothetical protein [Flavipsychrobacter sp.]